MTPRQAKIKIAALAGTAGLMIIAATMAVLDAPETAARAISVPIAIAATLWGLRALSAAFTAIFRRRPADDRATLDAITSGPLAAIAGLYAVAQWYTEGFPVMLIAYLAFGTVIATSIIGLWYVRRQIGKLTTDSTP